MSPSGRHLMKRFPREKNAKFSRKHWCWQLCRIPMVSTLSTFFQKGSNLTPIIRWSVYLWRKTHVGITDRKLIFHADNARPILRKWVWAFWSRMGWKGTSPIAVTWSGTVWFLSLWWRQTALSRTRILWSGYTSWRSPGHPERYWKCSFASNVPRLDGESLAIYSNHWRLCWVNKHFVLKVFPDNSHMAKCSWVGGTPCSYEFSTKNWERKAKDQKWRVWWTIGPLLDQKESRLMTDQIWSLTSVTELAKEIAFNVWSADTKFERGQLWKCHEFKTLPISRWFGCPALRLREPVAIRFVWERH
jgi:hypothetical protein